MRLLLVEGSARLRETIARALRRSGYKVDESADGDDGLWRATEFAYDGIVLDLTPREFRLLHILALEHGKVLSRTRRFTPSASQGIH